MNILREVRRVSNKSMPVRIMLLLTFCVMFIVTTYAWFSTQRNVTLRGLPGYTTAWDVSYYVNSDEDKILDQTVEFYIDELYPGMVAPPNYTHIYNIGLASTNIKYDLVSVKVFGQEILTEEDGNLFLNVYDTNEEGEEVVINKVPVTTTDDGKTTNVFSGDEAYPFNVSFTYDKTKLIGQYEEGGEYEDSAHAMLEINANWMYEGDEAKDILDTKFGKAAYSYYQDEENDSSKAIEVKVRITSSMVHPSEDPDYPYEPN